MLQSEYMSLTIKIPLHQWTKKIKPSGLKCLNLTTRKKYTVGQIKFRMQTSNNSQGGYS